MSDLKHESRHLKQHLAGLTLVELVVAMAIMGLLLALLLPAIQSSRETARRLSCLSNIKQIGVAVHNYHSLHSQLPIADSGFLLQLLPYIGSNKEYLRLCELQETSI